MKQDTKKTTADWEHLPDDGLLKLRIRDLGLRIEGSPLEPMVQRLHQELDARHILFRPPCYLADEWLCPDRVPVIGIPFYLAHPRLKHLEQKLMLEVEGGTEAECMRLLRHEAGHALNYAYLLFKRTRWRELFGPFSARYTERYQPRPYSRRYVVHLRDSYAQAHPDEDWAETFAVWLDPHSNWSEKYRDWPALRKLRYVDRLMKTVGPLEPTVTTGHTHWSAARMTSTLEAFYRRRRHYLREDFPGFYDPGLQRIFPVGPPDHPVRQAATFLRHHRRQIVNAVSTWTGERKYDVESLLGKLIRRCDDLQLTAPADPVQGAVNVASYVTAVMTNLSRFLDEGRGK